MFATLRRRREPRDPRSGRFGRVFGLAALILLSAAPAAAAPAPTAPAGGERRERVGPLLVSADGRDTVRGGRPDGATIHENFVARPVDPDEEGRAELARFERQAFAADPRPTIVAQPPEAWMAALTLPDLPVRWNHQTVAYLKYFRDDPKGQALIRGWLRRMNRYEHLLRPILKEAGVPEDLVFVAMAESGFNPRVRSRVGAAGMWQFMEGTGRVYGLERSYWVDERHDIERAAWAAATYLKDLRTRFGSWEMALAAYNGGPALVMTSLSRSNTNNFWALCELESGLPHATTLYIPKIIAAALIGRNRGAFGVGGDLSGALPPVHWAMVEVPPATSLAAVARLIGEDPALIEELNAHLVRKRTPPGRVTEVRIPRAKVAVYERGATRLAGESGDLQPHSVRYGETLARIAQRYGTSEQNLRKLNELDDGAELERGVTLLVPARGARGEPARPRPRVAVPRLVAGPDQRLVFFEVTRATTPRGLSEAFALAWDSVVRWNDLDPQARLQPGQFLQLLVPRGFDALAARVDLYEAGDVELVVRGSREHIESSLRERGLARRGYRVRKGDDLTKIGKKFDLSDGDLARINAIPRDQKPAPGSLLVVYVDKAHERGTVDAPPPRTPGAPAPDEPLPSSDEADKPAAEDSDAEPGAAPPADELGASTDNTSKLPGKRGWTRKPAERPRPAKPGKRKGAG
ncbi:MAG: transglycosylase SLT domain-containing protein [Myxococcales bacterium]|nr:transglycosylase SLT domain-containing protein [Myxococcales bacterium]